METATLNSHKESKYFPGTGEFLGWQSNSVTANTELDYYSFGSVRPGLRGSLSLETGSCVVLVTGAGVDPTRTGVELVRTHAETVPLARTGPLLFGCRLDFDVTRDLVVPQQNATTSSAGRVYLQNAHVIPSIFGHVVNFSHSSLFAEPQEAARQISEIEQPSEEISLREAQALALRTLHEAERRRINAVEAEARFLETLEEDFDEGSSA
jgi:hypothetical protein